jgi:NADH dehydrogenase
MLQEREEAVLVTGGAGFVGRHVVAGLQAAGYTRIRCLVHRRSPARLSRGKAAEEVAGDVQDPDSLARAVEGVDAVVHLVGVIREGPGATFQDVNHRGTANLVHAARQRRVRHVVYLSAIGATNEPGYQYAYSKWLGEQEVIQSGIPYTILRSSILFGAGDEFLNTLAAVLKLFPVVPVAGEGKNRFQPLAVQDLARCLALAVCQERYYGRILEIGGPQQYSYDQLVTLLIQTLGLRRLPLHVPVPVMRRIAQMMELVMSRPPVTREQLKYLDRDNVAEMDTVERHFGFTPRPLEGNLGYLQRLRWRDALAINGGFMPRHIRDH